MQRVDYQNEFERLLTKLRKYLDAQPPRKRKRSKSYIDDVELLKNYVEVKLKIERIPREVDIGKLGRHARNNYRNHFGTFAYFLFILGEAPPPPNVTNGVLKLDKESKDFETRRIPTVMGLINEFRRLRQDLGRPVTPKDIEEKSVYPLKEFEDVFKTFDRLNTK